MLELDNIRKKWVDKNPTQQKFDADNKKEFKIEEIWDNVIYAKESKGHLLGLYYLILWKNYLKKKNTWEPILSVQHLQKLISIFHKDDPNKSIAIASLVDITLSMDRLMIKPLAIK